MKGLDEVYGVCEKNEKGTMYWNGAWTVTNLRRRNEM